MLLIVAAVTAETNQRGTDDQYGAHGKKKRAAIFPSREIYGCPVLLLLIEQFHKARKKVQVLSACECFVPVIRNNLVWTRDQIRKEKMS